MIAPDETAGPVLEKQLTSAIYDCVVIGGGLRLPPKSLLLFEMVIKHYPQGRSQRDRHALQDKFSRCAGLACSWLALGRYCRLDWGF